MTRPIRAVTVVLVMAAATLVAAPAQPTVVDGGTSFIDQWLAATTTVALFGDARVSGAEVGEMMVEARGHHVVLRGFVDDAAARAAASAVAGRVPGVHTVANELRVVPATRSVPRDDDDIAEDVARALRRTRELDGARIRVSAADAIVTLAGTVPDVSDWVLASRTARNVVGVHAVESRLLIRHPRLARD